MNTSLAQFDSWLKLPKETSSIEFKEAKEQYDLVKLLRYCVALANEKGGKLILGVSDKRPRIIVGTKAFQNLHDIESTVFTRLRFRVDAEEVQVDGKRCLIFHVPSRPQGHAYELDGSYWMRLSEDTVAMSIDRLRQILDEGKPNWLEKSARENLTADEVFTFLDTESYFQLIGQSYPGNRIVVLDRLVHEKVIYKVDDFYTISNLGAVSFARKLADFGDLELKAIRVIAHDDHGKSAVRYDQTGVRGYAVGFERLMDVVNALIPSNEVVTKALREEHKMFPLVAIRELIANAIIHQDFQVTGSCIKIEVYPNRIEIRNPGIPQISTERFIDEDLSRNDRLSDLFRRLKICERRGSGIDNVIKSVESFQLPAPDFRQSDLHTTVILYAHKELSEMDREERIRACYQHSCLRYVLSEKMTNASLRERFNLPESKAETVTRILKDALDENKIKLADPSSTSTKFRSYLPYWA
jgi:ATP-dependent DNA helicase RecG